MGKPNKYGRHFGFKYATFGSDTNGVDVTAYGDTTGKYFQWDASADKLTVSGTLDTTVLTVGGVAGADFGPADITSITVVKGIVTAIS